MRQRFAIHLAASSPMLRFVEDGIGEGTPRATQSLSRNPLQGSDRATITSGPAREGEPIVYRPGQILLASDVPFGRLDGCVPQ